MINLPNFDANKFIDKACDFIKETVQNAHCNGVVLGLSGGIDSAVVAFLSVKALGKENVKGFILPSKTTSKQDLDDANVVAKQLGIETKTISIEDFHVNFINLCNPNNLENKYSTLASANIKPRIRMSILYYYATINNSLVIGTGNKTEISVGYFTKYGDGGVDLLPIGDLYKEEVKQVAKQLEVPIEIIEKAPSAGLLPEQTDEKELGITYPILDRLLYLYLEEGLNVQQIAQKLEISNQEVERIINLYQNSEHKRHTAPILRK